MTTFIEGKHRGEYIVSEANGSQSRETVLFAQGAAVVSACTVMGLVDRHAASTFLWPRPQTTAARTPPAFPTATST